MTRTNLLARTALVGAALALGSGALHAQEERGPGLRIPRSWSAQADLTVLRTQEGAGLNLRVPQLYLAQANDSAGLANRSIQRRRDPDAPRTTRSRRWRSSASTRCSTSSTGASRQRLLQQPDFDRQEPAQQMGDGQRSLSGEPVRAPLPGLDVPRVRAVGGPQLLGVGRLHLCRQRGMGDRGRKNAAVQERPDRERHCRALPRRGAVPDVEPGARARRRRAQVLA